MMERTLWVDRDAGRGGTSVCGLAMQTAFILRYLLIVLPYVVA